MAPTRADREAAAPRLEALTLPGTLEWVRAAGLRKRGREWCGPCPLCGGTDRFHVRETEGRPLVGCRGCLDGQPESERRRRLGEIVRAAFGNDGPRAPAPRKGPKTGRRRTRSHFALRARCRR